MDLYSYANGDPVNGLDPDGRMATAFGRGAKTDVGYLMDTAYNSLYGAVGGALKLAGVVENLGASGFSTWSSEGSTFGRMGSAVESLSSPFERAGWYANNNFTRAVQYTASMVAPLLVGKITTPRTSYFVFPLRPSPLCGFPG